MFWKGITDYDIPNPQIPKRLMEPLSNHHTEETLNAALESFKSLTTLTSVSTNQTELMARDFRKPTGKRGQ